MPREIVLGNGSLNVALDKKMQIRDFFYPLVGLENHAGHFFRFGVAVDGVFSWVNDNWEISTQYMPETLVSRYIAVNRELEIELEVNDAVYSFLDIYLRKIAIKNLSDRKREAKVFMSQDFHIYGEDTGDTAMYESVLQALIHCRNKRGLWQRRSLEGC
jgi:GH15 family glucan-1,4-alpha-glucosidase